MRLAESPNSKLDAYSSRSFIVGHRGVRRRGTVRRDPSTRIRRFGLCLEADPDLWAIVFALAQVDGREMAPPAETTNPALAAAIRAGHVNISGDSASSQTMELSETSRDAQDRHALLLQRVEAERRARAIVVPTQVKDVREKLRDLGHAVRLFGENDADVRERLRLLLARIETSGEAAAHADAPSAMTHLFHPMLVPTPTQPQRQGDMPADANGAPSAAADEASAAAAAQEALKSDVYTRASAELVAARGAIASLSFARSTERLATLRRRYSDVEQLNRETHRQYCAIMVRATRRPHCPRPPDLVILPTPPLPPFPPNHAPSPFSLSLSLSLHPPSRASQKLGAELSQFGDERPIAAVRWAPGVDGGVLASGGWSGAVKTWRARDTSPLERFVGHRERICAVAWQPLPSDGDSTARATEEEGVEDRDGDVAMDADAPPPPPPPRMNGSAHAAGASPANDDAQADSPPDPPRLLASASADGTARIWSTADTPSEDGGECLAVLEGHRERLSVVDWHPSGRYVATSSHDMTWRLWDVHAQQELLLQDGHTHETYGIAFHPDGSLIATTDFGGLCAVWDLRSGKMLLPLRGHVGRALAAQWAPDGYRLATAGDDHSCRVWDIRKKDCAYVLPAHSSLISDVRWSPPTGEALLTCGFDGDLKVWSTRDWTELISLRAHEGKVLAADWAPGGFSIVTAGYDRTIKLWRPEAGL